MTHGNAKTRGEPSAVPGTRNSELGRRAYQKLFPLIYPYSVCSFVRWISVKQVLSVLKLQLTATFRGKRLLARLPLTTVQDWPAEMVERGPGSSQSETSSCIKEAERANPGLCLPSFAGTKVMCGYVCESKPRDHVSA